MLWHPLALAALNQPPDVAAAPPFARVLAEMFGSDPRAAAIALPVKPLRPDVCRTRARLYRKPGRDGGDGRAGTCARRPRAVVAVDARRRALDRRASSCPPCRGSRWPTCSTATPPELSEILSRARRDGVVADRDGEPVVRSPEVLGSGIGDPFVGLPGPGHAVGVRQARGRSARARRTCRSCRAARRRSSIRPTISSIAAAHHELLEALPGIRPARLLRATVIREPRATFSLAPGQPRGRRRRHPSAACFSPATGSRPACPATIESAVRSGHRAATLASGNLSNLVIG